MQSSPSHLRRWEHLWGCVGRWFLLHIIFCTLPSGIINACYCRSPAAAGKTHSERALPSAVTTELLPWQRVPFAAFPCWQVRFSHCSMLWHHPARSSLTIRGRLDRRFLQAYPDYNNFMWYKRLIQKWSTETAAGSHTPELSHLLFWMREQIYILFAYKLNSRDWL